LNKFLDDKIFLDNEDFIILIEGVIYNKIELMDSMKKESWQETLIEMIRSAPFSFFDAFRGSFSGACYAKKLRRWVVFTDQIGEKAIFYYHKNDTLVVGSQLNYVTDTMKINGVKRDVDVRKLSQFMGFGYYLDDSTCVESVKRLYPGNYFVFEEMAKKFTVNSYYKADYEESGYHNSKYWINKFQETFINSMTRILNKAAEYKYKTLIDISAGADSRMIAYTANSLDADEILMGCYAQSYSKDAVTSLKIAKELGYNYVFLPLDNAECMMHIDDSVLMTNGCTMYCGITGGKTVLELLDRSSFGIEITGVLGDVYDGSMVVTHPCAPIEKNYLKYRFSTVLEPNKDFDFETSAENYFQNSVNDHFWFTTRGMIFGLTSYFVRQNFLEAATPFGDVEFLEAYLSSSWDDRVHGHLLRKWMIEYYPEAAEFEYGNSGLSIKGSVRKSADFKLNWIRRYKKYSRKIFGFEGPEGMNDFAYWYKNIPRFRNYLDTYIAGNQFFCEIDQNIYDKVQKLLAGDSMNDKLLAVTVMSIIKNYIA